MIIYLIVGLIKKRYFYIKMCYFSSQSHSENGIEVESDLFNCATKLGIKKATGVDTLQFAKKDDLANLKLEVDRLDTDELAELDADKLKPVFNYLSKLSNVVQNDVVKRDVYYNAKIKDIEDKMPDITN